MGPDLFSKCQGEKRTGDFDELLVVTGPGLRERERVSDRQYRSACSNQDTDTCVGGGQVIRGGLEAAEMDRGHRIGLINADVFVVAWRPWRRDARGVAPRDGTSTNVWRVTR